MSANLNYLGEYKDKAISRLISNQNIVDIILPNPPGEFEVEDQLRGDEGQGLRGYVFPYEFIPGVNEEAATFICLEDAVARVDTDNVADIILYVFVFTHKSLIKYKRSGVVGTRVDILASDVDKILNGASGLGIGKLKLERVEIYKNKNDDYYGRALTYSISDFNRDRSLNG